jgi:hypothetical protein
MRLWIYQVKKEALGGEGWLKCFQCLFLWDELKKQHKHIPDPNTTNLIGWMELSKINEQAKCKIIYLHRSSPFRLPRNSDLGYFESWGEFFYFEHIHLIDDNLLVEK